MKVADVGREIERHSLSSERAFSIKASGRAFKILSSSLYRDKIRAIIRELSCNAYDAHVAAGYPDRPFQVHLPNRFEPFFSVKDTGIGLSPEEIGPVYTTYFESTKTESNDYIGALGLGSKSPFSYVDSFTVASCYNGVKYTYAAFLSEYGEPVLTLMSQLPTEEHNGIEVSMPVKYHHDFSDFYTKARSVLSSFKVRPNVVGCAEFYFDDFQTVVQGDGWKITERALPKTSGYENTPHAIMGNVVYPIVTSAIGTLSIAARNVYNVGLDIDFPIGSLDVTAGREDLSYDKATLKVLEDRAKEILADAPTRFQKMFDECQNEYEARSLYHRIYYLNRAVSYYLFDNSAPSMVFKGKTISSSDFVLDLRDASLNEVGASLYNDNRKKYHKSWYSRMVVHVYTGANTTVMIDDLNGKKGLRGRINLRRKTHENENLIIFEGNAEQLKSVEYLLDGYPISYTSSLPKPAPVKRDKPAVGIMASSMFYTYQNKFDDDCWENDDEFDLDAGGIYVRRRGNTVLTDDGYGNFSPDTDFLKHIRLAIDLGIFSRSTEVHGFDAVTMRKAKESKGTWIDLNDHLKDEIGHLLFKQTDMMAARMRISAFEDHYRYMSICGRKTKFSQIANLSQNPLLVDFVNDWNKSIPSDARAYDEKLRSLCRHYKISVPEADMDLVNRMKDILRKYPLLCIFESYTDLKIDVAHMVEYVRWIDQKTDLTEAA